LILLSSLGRNLPLQPLKGEGIDPRSTAPNLENNAMARWNQNDEADRLENESERTRNQSKGWRRSGWMMIRTKTNDSLTFMEVFGRYVVKSLFCPQPDQRR
jgi:hypothetical protein